MQSKRIKSIISLLSALFFAACATIPQGSPEAGYSVHGFVGTTATQAAPGQQVSLLNASSGVLQTQTTNFMGAYAFSGLSPGYYELRVGTLAMEVVLTDANQRIDIDLSNPSGAMNYANAPPPDKMNSANAPPPDNTIDNTTAAASGTPPGPNDAELASQIAGTWYGYHGSTETKIGLCPGGVFKSFTESSYSGSNSDLAWGAASQGGGSGSWSIQGDTQSGTITVGYGDGTTKAVQYKQTGESGCLFFDETKLCRTSAQCQ